MVLLIQRLILTLTMSFCLPLVAMNMVPGTLEGIAPGVTLGLVIGTGMPTGLPEAIGTVLTVLLPLRPQPSGTSCKALLTSPMKIGNSKPTLPEAGGTCW